MESIRHASTNFHEVRTWKQTSQFFFAVGASFLAYQLFAPARLPRLDWKLRNLCLLAAAPGTLCHLIHKLGFSVAREHASYLMKRSYDTAIDGAFALNSENWE